MKGQYKIVISRYLAISIVFVAAILYFNSPLLAQYSKGQMIDKIIAKVDDYIVLKSDLDKAYLEFVSSGQEGGEEVRCGIFESLVISKLLVAKAEIDSVIVLDEEVQMNLDQRMQIILSQIGSEERLEEYYGKSVDEFKIELFDDIKEQLIADKMQRTITEGVSVTPSEVKRFFNRIPADSLPFFSTEVSVGQIVIIPEVGENQKNIARAKLLDIRNRIVKGPDLTDTYGGWTLKLNSSNNLELIDNAGTKYTGTWEYSANDRLFSITLNEISFTANEFQFTWKLTKFGGDSLLFENNDISNTSKFTAYKPDDESRASPVISMDFLLGTWQITSFNGDGEDFATLAREFSEDPGSARTGGELGYASRGTMVPEYEAAAMTMKPGEISEPIETDFGYHLIQLIDRRGNEFNSRHILIRPDFTAIDFEKAEDFLDSLKNHIIHDSLVFEKAAKEFSDDDVTAGNGGFMIDQSGSTRVSVEDLDPVVFFTIDTMEVGNISQPLRYRMKDGKEAVRILYYKDRVKPHKANLKEDYQKIQLATMNEKRQEVMEKWFDRAKNDVFIQIDDDYKYCNVLELY
jgi:parvulin-like peptidyl-prolyl isomerase